MKTTRKDRLGRILRTGEEQLRDGRYRFRGKGAMDFYSFRFNCAG